MKAVYRVLVSVLVVEQNNNGSETSGGSGTYAYDAGNGSDLDQVVVRGAGGAGVKGYNLHNGFLVMHI